MANSLIRRLKFPLALLICLSGLALLTGLPLQAAGTEAPAPEFKVKPLFEGYYRDGNWASYQISLRNGPQPWRGEVRATLPYTTDTSYTYTRSVELASGAETSFFFYFLPTRYEPRLEIGLYDSAGKPVGTKPVQIQPITKIDYVIGVLADSTQLNADNMPKSGIIRYRQNETRLIFVPLPPQELPDQSVAYNTLDAVIVGELDPAQLPQPGWQALRAWVAQGGRLWISGGSAQLAKINAALGPAMAPASQQGTVQVNNLTPRSLPDIRWPTLKGQNIKLQSLVPENGARVAVMSEETNLPLAINRVTGRGIVTATAFDLFSAPFTDPNQTKGFWSELAETTNPTPEHTFVKQSLFTMTALPRLIVSQPPEQTALPLMLLAGLLLLSLGIIGGGFYLARRFDQPLVALLVAPSLALLTGLTIWGICAGLNKGQVQLNRVAFVNYDLNDGQAAIRTINISAGSDRDNYSLEMLSPNNDSNFWLYRPQNIVLSDPRLQTAPPQLFAQSGRSVVRGASGNGGRLQGFSTESTLESQLPLKANLAVLPDASGLAGTIENSSHWTFSDVTLVLGSNYLSVGDLAAGEIRQIIFPLSNRTGFLPAPSVDPNLYNATINSNDFEQANSNPEQWHQNLHWLALNTAYLNGQFNTIYQNYNLYFTGWLDGKKATDLIGSAKASDGLSLQEQDWALVIKPLPLSYQPSESSNRLVIPAAVMTANRLAATNFTSGADGNFNVGEGGYLLLQYQLPTRLRLSPSRLTLYTEAEDNAAPGLQSNPQLEIFNWKKQSWDLIVGEGDGQRKITLTGPNLSDYLEPDGNFVRLKASVNSQPHTIKQINLELDSTF